MSDQRARSKMSCSPSGCRSRSSKRTLREANNSDSKARDTPDDESKPPLTPTLKVPEDVSALGNRRRSSIRFEGSPNRSSAFSRSRSLRAPKQHLSQPNIYEETTMQKKHASFSHSFSVPGDPRDFQRLRNFSVTSKGVINRGDSFRAKTKTSSAQKIASDTDEKALSVADLPQNATQNEPQKADYVCSAESSTPSAPLFRVWILGSPGVGKSSLKQQFMTSEYICENDAWNDELNQKSVIIVVNGDESELELIECNGVDDKGRNEFQNPDAYIIVYSVTNRRSFIQAKHLLSKAATSFASKATILVGNKTDLARLRTVTTVEGRTLAKEHGVKFIETSVAINHQVDELLVGTITQIRIKSKAAEKLRKSQESRGSSDSPSRPQRSKSKAPGIIKRIWRKTCRISKSCDNLHAL